jgi:glucokinase
MDWAIGVDLGGTKIEVAAVGRDGRVLERLIFPTKVHGDPDATEEAIVEAVGQLKVEGTPVGLGVGIAGQISPEDGSVIFAPNLEWSNVPICKQLGNKLGMPVVVTNDVRAATWGEWRHGAGKGCDHLVCLFVGTGIGGGVVSEGKMLEGCGNSAGELGHMVVDLNGPACNCGGQGCLEAFAGGLAIAREARERLSEDASRGPIIIKLAQGDLGQITTRIIVDAYEEKDPLAIELIDRAAHALTAGCASIVNAFNPCRLILGGGVIEGLPTLIDRVQDGIDHYALGAATRPLTILHATLKNEAGTIGAATLAMEKFGQ